MPDWLPRLEEALFVVLLAAVSRVYGLALADAQEVVVTSGGGWWWPRRTLEGAMK